MRLILKSLNRNNRLLKKTSYGKNLLDIFSDEKSKLNITFE